MDVIQGNRAVGVAIWEQKLGADRGHAKITRGIKSSIIQTDYGDDGTSYDKQRVGLALGGLRARDGRDLANQGVHTLE